jgi:pimeloyl-ACP methyl ester carboxylesterase
MFKTGLVMLSVAVGMCLAESGTSKGAEMKLQVGDTEYAAVSPPLKSGYVKVNGLEMYYEIHGSGGTPLVLLPGAFSGIGTSFGKLLPDLAKSRQVVAFELQGQGRTADIDRPLSMEQMAEDVAAALPQLGIEKADVFGYSLGGGVALQLVIQHPERVRKLVLMSIAYNREGSHPGFWDAMEGMKPEMMYGSPWHEEYLKIAPKPEDFDKFFAKKTVMDKEAKDVPAETFKAIKAPTLIVMGDSDMFRPEHAVEMFRLLGGGVMGDLAGLPNSQLAILPGVSHVSIANRADLLLPMITPFLDAPMPAAK